MDYAAFVEALAGDQRTLSVQEPPNLVTDMCAYLTQLARRVLAGLDRDGDESTCRRLAAVSGMVRACPPEAALVLDRPDLAELAMARLDILVPRKVIAAEPNGEEGTTRWRIIGMESAAERLAQLAERTGLFCPAPALLSWPATPRTALALVTRTAAPSSIEGLSGLRHILWLGATAEETPWLQTI